MLSEHERARDEADEERRGDPPLRNRERVREHPATVPVEVSRV